jgi:hypothetical protein
MGWIIGAFLVGVVGTDVVNPIPGDLPGQLPAVTVVQILLTGNRGQC